MPNFNTSPGITISVDDARRLIHTCGDRKPLAFARRLAPRRPVTLRLWRRRFQIAAVGLAAAWLVLPRGDVFGLVFLMAAVAAGQAELGRWKRGRR